MIGSIISFIIGGGIIGALARLVLPGKQDISVLQTVGIGALSSLVFGTVLDWLFLPGWLAFIASVAVAAGAIWWFTSKGSLR